MVLKKHKTSRASTLPLLTSNIQSTSYFLPSIEESLQDWISRSIPDTYQLSSQSTYVLDTQCKCCQRSECEYFDSMSCTIKKLDQDARLAATLGQNLLQKHEQYVNESNEIKNEYEQKIELLNEKICQLEQSLLESDIFNKEHIDQKNKHFWEWQKTQKALDEATRDLETVNQRCLQMGSELKSKMNEIEQLRIYKFMLKQSETREETIKSKLEDIRQELSISRKAELLLESKHNKLKRKYESKCIAYDKLKMDQQEMGITKDSQVDLLWLKESNEKLRKDLLQLTNAMITPDFHMTNADQHYQLVELIKKLTLENHRLKSELIQSTDDDNSIITKSQAPNYVMQHDNALSPPSSCGTNTALSRSSNFLKRTESKRCIIKQDTPKSIVPISNSKSELSNRHSYCSKDNQKSVYNINNRTQKRMSFTSTTLHENVDTNDTISNSSSFLSSTLSTQLLPEKTDNTSPFHQLYNQVTHLLSKIQQTDIITLNRRLKKAFDMFELSGMSNTMIEHIITEIDSMKSGYSWIEEEESLNRDECWANDISMLAFFPIVEVAQEMLKEISYLRTTMNDLQLDYVKKIKKSDVQLEKELLKKQSQRRESTHESNNTPFNWFMKLFQKLEMKESNNQHDLFNTYHRNESETSLQSNSMVHPLSTKTIEIKRRASDVDRFGPLFSFPSKSYLEKNMSETMLNNNTQSKRRSTIQPTYSSSSQTSNTNTNNNSNSTNNQHHLTITKSILRTSHSTGTSRKKSQSIQGIEYVIRRKRSTLSSFSNDYDLLTNQQLQK